MNLNIHNFDHGELEKAFQYIDAYWSKLERLHRHDEGTLIGLPKPYIVPSIRGSSGFAFEEMYYWDSYFIAQGLIGTRREHLAKDMLDNLLYLMQRFGVIPNASRFYLTGRSQPPILTSFIRQVYLGRPKKSWLIDAMFLAKDEYRRVWLGVDQPHNRKVFHGLSRYYDVNLLHDLAEAESGWDMTTRFGRSCLSYVVVDLNALLYKYEIDFAWAADLLDDRVEAVQWRRRARNRKLMFDRFFWDDSKGFYFDYDFEHMRRSNVWSLAGFYPLWVGMATRRQAERVVENLDRFEVTGGLTATSRPSLNTAIPAQWTYPNGWAPLHFIVVQSLRHYGYPDDADRIARKWLALNLRYFRKEGLFMEKYNVVKPDEPAKNGVYPNQTGFGWTNAIFWRLAHDLLTQVELTGEFQEESALSHV
jgi:alpha,alpha-trehalase